MATTYFGSRLRAGSTALTESTDGGDVKMVKSVTLTSTSNGNTDGSVTIPANSKIVRIYANKTVAWSVGAGSATTLLVTAGSAAGGAQYMASTDLASATNASGPTTVATNLACASVGTNTVVYFRVATNGTVLTTQAQVDFIVEYIQTV